MVRIIEQGGIQEHIDVFESFMQGFKDGMNILLEFKNPHREYEDGLSDAISTFLAFCDVGYFRVSDEVLRKLNFFIVKRTRESRDKGITVLVEVTEVFAECGGVCRDWFVRKISPWVEGVTLVPRHQVQRERTPEEVRADALKKFALRPRFFRGLERSVGPSLTEIFAERRTLEEEEKKGEGKKKDS